MGIIKVEKPPVPPYVHQHYPKMLFNKVDGAVVTQIVKDPVAHAAATKAGWVETPAELGAGVETTTSDEQMAELLDANEKQAAELESVKAELEALRNAKAKK